MWQQPRLRQLGRNVVDHVFVGIDDAVVQVGRRGGVVEEQQLAGMVIDLGVGRDADVRRERSAAAVRIAAGALVADGVSRFSINGSR